jgi:hypothetical protein
MTWLETQNFFVGKVFLIGLTFLDADSNPIEDYETSGTVEELTDEGMLVFKKADGNLFQLPYEPETVHTAEKGDYKERGTGNIIVDPDFITVWKIRVNDGDNLDELKSKGYIE